MIESNANDKLMKWKKSYKKTDILIIIHKVKLKNSSNLCTRSFCFTIRFQLR